jgi:hypothetical protein
MQEGEDLLMHINMVKANDHTAYNWIIDSGATEHMTFE